ncbi:TraR/DksA family transcriptional regulator [Streptomyces iconiensis]|uniref:DksA C4-type domain-containing protein n=1 Tax=Streptomyces iconiensis TaxID=1384038 RepID=A0ABT6ZRF8_9ACTN|nr:hypothetical protein [Streptomyces iconiensis]MDJ1131635.1 hypothetical protein [Streptomyces iconiensis]
MKHQVISPDVLALGPEDHAVLGSEDHAVLRPEDLAAFRAALLAQRRFHLARLRDVQATGTVRTGTPEAAAHARKAASARMMLTDVEAALIRIDEGRYGACHRCAEPIPRAQLEVVPHARYCGSCRRGRGARR